MGAILSGCNPSVTERKRERKRERRRERAREQEREKDRYVFQHISENTDVHFCLFT